MARKKIAKSPKSSTEIIETRLNNKHLRALELIESGACTPKEISKAVGISEQTLSDLVSGRADKLGVVADLFSGEIKRIQIRNTEMVRFLAKDCTKLALQKMNDHLRALNNDDLSDTNLQKLIAVVTALSKQTPRIEIGQVNQQNNIFNELTPTEMHHEYRRLTNLAQNLISLRRRVSRPSEGATGEVLESSE